MKNRTFQAGCFAILTLAILGSTFVLVGGGAASVPRYTGPLTLLALAFLVVAGGFCAAENIRRAFQAPLRLNFLTSDPKSNESPVLRWLFRFSLLGVVSLSYFQISSPLDWDELDTASRIASPGVCRVEPHHPYRNLDLLNPFTNTRNHGIANLGVKAIFRALPVSEVTARTFSFLLTLSLVIILGIFLPNRVGLSCSLALATHLIVNGLFQWYSHSLRGYISMIFFTVALLLILLAKELPRFRAFSLVILTTTAALAALSHSFGALFVLFVFTSYLFWLSYHAGFFSREALIFHTQRLICLLATVPLALALLGSQYWFLKRIGYVHTTEITASWSTVFETLGLYHPLVGWVVVCLVGVAFLARLTGPRRHDFLSFFIPISFFILGVLITSLKSTLFESRFLLAFLVPLFIYLYQGLESVSLRPAKALSLGILLLALLVAPLRDWAQITQNREAGTKAFSEFMRASRFWTQHSAPQCLSFSGEEDQVQFARGLYAYQPPASQHSHCPVRYHFHFGKYWGGTLPLENAIAYRFRPLFSDTDGRVLLKSVEGITHQMVWNSK